MQSNHHEPRELTFVPPYSQNVLLFNQNHLRATRYVSEPPQRGSEVGKLLENA